MKDVKSSLEQREHIGGKRKVDRYGGYISVYVYMHENSFM